MLFGYAGKVLRVDLVKKLFSTEQLSQSFARKWVGGVGLGVKYLYDEVPPSVSYDSPDNKVIMSSGPLGATSVSGSGTICIVTKGAMTGGITSSQANGYFGAYLKLCGYDAVILEGEAPEWVYLYITDEGVEFRSAQHLLGINTWDIEDVLKQEIGAKEISVYSIGAAGEHKVRFAALVGDKGHVVAHNGPGAVLGSKKVKAIVVRRGHKQFPLYNKAALNKASRAMVDGVLNSPKGAMIHNYGTIGQFAIVHPQGALPVKNYTTSIFNEVEQFLPQNIRKMYSTKKITCWACRIAHNRHIKITEGSYAGITGDEPEYEGMAAFGPQIGNSHPDGALMLNILADELALDHNECGWLVGWVMELYERGILSSDQLDGLPMEWGNVEATRKLLIKIAHREGCGEWLAEGVKRAAEKIGGKALECAIYTLKGNCPRSYDFRANWFELFDTCVSNTGTIETTPHPASKQFNLDIYSNPFSSLENTAKNVAITNGRRVFEDCLGICRFPTDDKDLDPLIEAFNCATGWDLKFEELIIHGKRIVNLMRLYNLRSGITGEMDRPSKRFGSIPTDGPAAGVDPGKDWKRALQVYYQVMGWDENGVPLEQTLNDLDLS